MIRRILRWLGRYLTDAVIRALEIKLAKLTELELPRLRRELELERGENLMLKEKLASWRMEVQRDAATKAAQIADA